jgi:hypothetical protein
VVWDTGQFYPMFFLGKVLKVDEGITNLLTICATVATAPLYIFFGWLVDGLSADAIGPIMRIPHWSRRKPRPLSSLSQIQPTAPCSSIRPAQSNTIRVATSRKRPPASTTASYPRPLAPWQKL